MPALDNLKRFDPESWQPDIVGTLIFLTRGDDVLLIRKKRGHGAGKINGPGGKLDPGETPLECVLRETREEVGVDLPDAQLMARLRFVDSVDADWLGWIYVAEMPDQTPIETDEADPFFAPVAELPLAQMWPDDAVWLPWVLRRRALTGTFFFESGALLGHAMALATAEDDLAAHLEDRLLTPR